MGRFLAATSYHSKCSYWKFEVIFAANDQIYHLFYTYPFCFFCKSAEQIILRYQQSEYSHDQGYLA